MKNEELRRAESLRRIRELDVLLNAACAASALAYSSDSEGAWGRDIHELKMQLIDIRTKTEKIIEDCHATTTENC